MKTALTITACLRHNMQFWLIWFQPGCTGMAWMYLGGGGWRAASRAERLAVPP